uniref:RING-type domain-containing protein n=1 Tax=Phytophthora ramorum TaxID=164328 RepID=H3HBC8_PHYRM
MAQDGDAPARPAPLSKKAEEARRNRLNMEKMIMKNVAASRSSTKNRAQQIVEALKKKRQQQEDAGDDSERLAKKHKPSSDRAAVAAGLLSPTRRPNHALGMRSPAPQLASPARARVVNPLHLSSPVRPPRNAVLASPARPRRSSTAASPMRRRDFLTSPLRHRASASPKRPLMFDDTMTGDALAQMPATRINGHPPLLASALDQVEVAPTAKANKVVRTAKSPFQSFQAKFNTKQSPVRPAPGDEIHQDDVISAAPRSGPTLVDFTHSDEVVAQQTTAISAATSSASTAPSTSATAAATAGSGSANALQTGGGAPFTPAPPPKPVRKLFSSRPVVAQKSICFSTEGIATALDVTPDGEIIVVGFTDGSVRLYEMDSSVPSDRHGYLLGHIDEQSSQGSPNVHLRVKISPDSRYVFVGCRQGPRVIMSINLDHYRSEKDGDDDDFQQFQKHFYSNSKLRGFADVTTSAYYILTGLGIGNLNLWRFVEPKYQHNPIWEHLQNFGAGGNTAMTGAFLPSSISPGVLTIAAVYASNLNPSTTERLRRQDFELEKLDSNGSDVGSSEMAMLRIIGRNASENTLFKTPMKVYAPMLTSNGKQTKSEAMMAVVTNPSSEDSEDGDGYFNVDPTEVFAARWMVPSRGENCWKRRVNQNSGAGDDDEDYMYTGSDDNTPSVASLLNELEHFKKRNAEIKTEWQRRLQGERQLRRKWKQREDEFLDQLNDSLTKLDTAEVEVDRLRVLLRDAEKRFAFEKARMEQESSVKARYEQLCEQMNVKMALVTDQKRLLEQTTRSLLTEVDRNVHALKNAVILEKSECVVCKDRQAVTAVVPCGHLCFCEQDAETYHRNCTSEYPTCPICQQEIVSLLRIYS